MRKEMGNTAVSAVITFISLFSDPLNLAKWNQAKKKNCNFATSNRIVDKRTSIIQTEPNYIKRLLENESKPTMNF